MLLPLINGTVPIFALIGLGWLSRRMGWLRAGDERVLNAYVYYFALPAMFFADLAEIRADPERLRFVLACCLPVPAAFLALIAARRILGFPRELLDLLLVSAAFGSLAFFGLPFLRFAFPEQDGRLATLAAAAISAVGVSAALLVLELRAAPAASGADLLRGLAARLSRNPLILSIAGGVFASLLGLRLPALLSRPLHMLGSTTMTVAVFLLGMFLFGRPYRALGRASALALIRAALLPLVALACAALLGITGFERVVLVLMHGMPLAISMIVLSERYDFHKETVASILLVSSMSAPVVLGAWLWLLSR